MDFLPILQAKIRPIAAVLAAAGPPAAFYYAFDLRYPNHFVGDMYGLEVMARSVMLLIACLCLAVGLLMTVIGWKKGEGKLLNAGLILADLCSAVLMVLALNVYHSRAIDDRRKTYPHKHTDELIRIAAEEKDQFAMYEILARQDASAVPALIALLLDENQDVRIRLESAHALGQLGGPEARAALEKASAMSGGNRYLTETIRYSIDHIDRHGTQ